MNSVCSCRDGFRQCFGKCPADRGGGPQCRVLADLGSLARSASPHCFGKFGCRHSLPLASSAQDSFIDAEMDEVGPVIDALMDGKPYATTEESEEDVIHFTLTPA